MTISIRNYTPGKLFNFSPNNAGQMKRMNLITRQQIGKHRPKAEQSMQEVVRNTKASVERMHNYKPAFPQVNLKQKQ